MDPREEIRNRLGIEEVVGQYVQMKKSGRNFKACCPFHQEKTPSFIISPDKGLAYCFGCRKGGDIFAFVQEVENVTFPEALKILGEKAGIEVQQTFNKQTSERKQVILGLIEEAQRFFVSQLNANAAASKYLSDRGYDKKLQQQLGLGFAPDSFHELTKALETKGFSSQEILDAGLAAQKQVGDSNVYDRFRNRIMFPIHDTQGRLVAFGGRTLSKDDPAKYLNSPETKYYHKGQTLYCFHMAKQAIREQDQAIIVEGYFDALTCQAKGFPQTVASLGTALTEDQIKLLKRFTKNLLFAFDADPSGQAAASRSVEIAQRLGLNVSVITIPAGKDPDEALRTAPAEWEKMVAEAVPAVDYEIQKACKQHDIRSIQGKKSIAEYVLPIIQRLANAIEQEHYLKKLSLELDTSLRSLFVQLRGIKASYSPPQTDNNVSKVAEQPVPSRFEHLAGLITIHPQYSEQILSDINKENLERDEEKKLYTALSAQYNHSESKGQTESVISDEERQRLQFLELYAEENYSSFSQEDIATEVNDLTEAIRKDYQRRRLQELRYRMAKEPNNTDLATEYTQLLSQ
ncbi:MAG: DNA primase [Candidatus Gracilibacteria bacterium]|nr:DNA primase [Candidatus Gracilibacteria bacterium]